MHVIGMVLGGLSAMLFIGRASASFIDLSNLQGGAAQYAALGVRIHPTGAVQPQEFFPGELEVLGVNNSFLQNPVTTHNYSGQATFSTPASSITFDVARENNSQWSNTFSISAYFKGKHIREFTVALKPIGDWTHITVAAADIDKVIWKGTNWVFQPYVVRDMVVNFASAVTQPSGNGDGGDKVGQSVPEPGSIGLFGLAAVSALARRRTRKITPPSLI